MMGAAPTQDTSDAGGVFALLGIISDPEKAAKVMSDLATATKNNQDALKALQEAQAAKLADDEAMATKLATAKDEADAAAKNAVVEQGKNNDRIAMIAGELAEQRRVLDARASDLDARTRTLEDSIRATEAAQAERKAELDRLSAETREQSDRVKTQLAQTSADATAAASLKATYEAKLEQAKSLWAK